jgi:hypothetical protein
MPQNDGLRARNGPDRFARDAKRLAFAWIPLLVLQTAAFAEDRQPEHGCLVRTDDVDARGVAEVSADCRWSIPPEHVVGIVRDQDAIDEVLSSLSESTLLPDGRVLQVHSTGWVAADRQVTLRFDTRRLPDDGLRSDFERAAEQKPLAPGRVQVALDRGWWEIHPDGRGGTHLRYTVRYDAGGNLKPWIVRRFQKAGVARSMEELRLAAERAAQQPAAASAVSSAPPPQPERHAP